MLAESYGFGCYCGPTIESVRASVRGCGVCGWRQGVGAMRTDGQGKLKADPAPRVFADETCSEECN
jgi:hypothetical protein